MKREIKFRVFINEKWHYFQVGQIWSPASVELYNLAVTNGLVFYQYTGLKDKNGVEIYEGDILRLHEYQGEVYKEVLFYNGSFCVHGFNWDRRTVEVIGNTYQNHELLTL